MAIEGLIILDKNNRSIIQSGFRSTTPAYPLLHIDSFTNAFEHAVRPDDVDPVIYVPPISSELKSSACCHISVEDVHLLACSSDDLDPMFAFAFMKTFNDILVEYFGTVNSTILRDNFDVVYQLLEETLDSGGHPLTTSPNSLRDIVLPPSMLTKLLGAANLTHALNINTGNAAAAFASPIPWRKAGLRYSSNEIFFDIEEELKAVVNKHGSVVSSVVRGKIESNSKLSGTPDCLLSFLNAHVLADCAFHPCVRIQRFARDKSLSFVPPDGKFTLMDYRFSPSSTPSTSVPTQGLPSMNVKDIVGIPFAVKGSANLSVQSKEVSFDFSFFPRAQPPTALETITLEWYLGLDAGSVKATVSKGSGGFPSSSRGGFGNTPNATKGLTVGSSWTWDVSKKILRWEIPSVAPSSSWNIKGSFSAGTTRPASALQVRFILPSNANTFSALKVGHLRVTGETYKPFKGVRGRGAGSVEWRIVME